MITHNSLPVPSTSQLLRATGIALAAAGVILVTTVLPAEYGIDPLHTGSLLGITGMSAGRAAPAEVVPVPAGSALVATAPDNRKGLLPGQMGSAADVSKSDRPLRTEEMSIVLEPNKGGEIKAHTLKGERFVFSWTAEGGPVNSDMHGEPPNPGPNEFSTYWKVKDTTGGQGSFIAPFDGAHGWYWRNKGSKAVTVTVKVSGFFDKLYKPEAPNAAAAP